MEKKIKDSIDNELLRALVRFTFATFFNAFSVGGGTMLWLVYPHIHALFPTAAENGIIAANIDWLDSVCVVGFFTVLLKPSGTSHK